jgi:hypothetical protein
MCADSKRGDSLKAEDMPLSQNAGRYHFHELRTEMSYYMTRMVSHEHVEPHRQSGQV